MARTYEKIELEWMRDESGAPTTFFAKGHHEPEGFLRELRAWLPDNPEVGRDFEDYAGHPFGRVWHGWYRTVPVAPWDDPGFGYYYYPAEPKSRGAFPATTVDVI
jgi:hypothetical protein